MPTILDQIAAHTRQRVSESRRHIPLTRLRSQVEQIVRDGHNLGQVFENALAKPGISFICECKQASPSKGLIEAEYDPVGVALDYAQAQADAISVLTEPQWFLGSDEHLRQVASAVPIPCLRKDFTVDEYMIYQARLLGASAVLLICSILSPSQLRDYLALSAELGLAALVETHDEAEIESALTAGASVLGVNNRNLKDFTVDTSQSSRLRALVPYDVVFVAESGVWTREDVAALDMIGVDAVLIGEAMMRAEDKTAKLAQLRGIPAPVATPAPNATGS